MTKRKVVLVSLLLLVAVAGAVLVRWADPLAAWFPKCWFKMLTGFDCPGCGTGRAAHLLLNGDVLGAMRMNPLLFPAVAFAALLVLKPSVGYKKATPLIVGIVVVAYWILRNIP